MHTTNQILDALAAKHGGASDYRLHKILSTSGTSTVGNWRKGRSSLSQDYALKIAALLGWHPEYVIACVERERAKKDARVGAAGDILAVWARIAAKFRPALPVILTVALLGVGAAIPEVSRAAAFDRSIHYAHFKRRRRRPLLDRIRRIFCTVFPIHDSLAPA